MYHGRVIRLLSPSTGFLSPAEDCRPALRALAPSVELSDRRGIYFKAPGLAVACPAAVRFDVRVKPGPELEAIHVQLQGGEAGGPILRGVVLKTLTAATGFVRPDDPSLATLEQQHANLGLGPRQGLYYHLGAKAPAVEEHSRVAFRVRPSPNGGFEAYDVEVLERAAAAGSVAVGLQGEIQKVIPDQLHGFIKVDSQYLPKIQQVFGEDAVLSLRGIYFRFSNLSTQSQGMVPLLGDRVKLDVVQNTEGKLGAKNVELVRQRLLKADIEAFLKPVLAEGTASSRLCLLTANVSQWRAVLDSDQLEESQVKAILLLLATLAEAQLRMKGAEEQLYSAFRDTRFLKLTLPDVVKRMCKRQRLLGENIDTDFLFRVLKLCTKVNALRRGIEDDDPAHHTLLELRLALSRAAPSADVVVLAQQVDNLLEDTGGGEPRGDQREPLIPNRGQWVLEVLDLELLYPHLAELQNPRVFNAAQRPSMRPDFHSVDAYIDAMYHLLRADCFQQFAWAMGLALGLVPDQEGEACPLSKEDLKYYATVHTNVMIVGLTTQQSGLVYLAHVPPRPGGREFAYGNLVCLLPDVEQPWRMFWLAVAESRPALTEKGLVGLRLLHGRPTELRAVLCARQARGLGVTLVEARMFFIGYQPVLEALAAFHSTAVPCHTLPFTSELLQGVVYDQSDLFGPLKRRPPTSAPRWVQNGPGRFAEAVDEICRRYCLDPSQAAAVRLLTQPMFLVQGPPGTGKSYVAARMVEVLYSLRHGGGAAGGDPALQDLLAVERELAVVRKQEERCSASLKDAHQMDRDCRDDDPFSLLFKPHRMSIVKDLLAERNVLRLRLTGLFEKRQALRDSAAFVALRQKQLLGPIVVVPEAVLVNGRFRRLCAAIRCSEWQVPHPAMPLSQCC